MNFKIILLGLKLFTKEIFGDQNIDFGLIREDFYDILKFADLNF